MELLVLLVIYGLQGDISAEGTTPFPKTDNSEGSPPWLEDWLQECFPCNRIDPPCLQPSTSGSMSLFPSNDVPIMVETNTLSSTYPSYVYEAGPSSASERTIHQGESSVSVGQHGEQRYTEECFSRQEYFCEVCCRGFDYQLALKRHMLSHTDYRPFSCKICTKSFKRIDHLKLHMRIHSGRCSYSCMICSKSFKSLFEVDSHMKVHSDERPFPCEQCGTFFKRRSDLQKHLRTHSSDRPFSCDLCGKSFKSQSNMEDHVKTHNDERLFPCEVCSKSFKRKSHLKTHMETHSDKRPFSCELCSRRFKKKPTLEIHLKTHSAPRPYLCELCNESFITEKDLRSHIDVHDDERPFSCELCGKSFKRKTNLRDHMKIHSSKLPVSREICSKRYKGKGNLIGHTRSHANEELFASELYKESFESKRILEQHMELHESNECQEEFFPCTSRTGTSCESGSSNYMSIHEQNHVMQGHETNCEITGSNHKNTPNDISRITLEARPECSYSQQAGNREVFDHPMEEAADSDALTAVYENALTGIDIVRQAVEVAFGLCDENDALEVAFAEQMDDTTEPTMRRTSEPRE